MDDEINGYYYIPIFKKKFQIFTHFKRIHPAYMIKLTKSSFPTESQLFGLNKLNEIENRVRERSIFFIFK